MTITYEYEDALYVNLTNKCNCNCEFCLRHGRKEGSIYTEDSLWLEREPTRKEALDSFLSRDVCSYREIVFCGYGVTAAEYTALCHPAQGEAAYQAMLDFAREATRYVPHVVLTIVDKDKSSEEIETCRQIAAELGVKLRIRSFIDS